jgi:Pyruvate/2-oxoacid:ferredoxin oxidoreductase delta subunit
MNTQPRILYCHCVQARLLSDADRQAVLARLCASGVDFEAVPDLCALAMRRDVLLQKLARASELIVIACHARAVRGLFAAAGAPLREDAVKLLDLRKRPAAEILPELPAAAGGSRDAAQMAAELEAHAEAKPAWFPVVDSARCTQCLQCQSFCLFGVYGKNADGQLEVRHPGNCKPDCPACARVCPELAIIFPRYKQEPINGGEVTAADAAREPVKVDVSALLGGDVYKTLRSRGAGSTPRFAPDRDAAQAQAERRKCLEQLQRDLDIPPELLHSLPLPGLAPGGERETKP